MCQLFCHSPKPGSELSNGTASSDQAKNMDDSTGRPGTACIPNISSQPTPTAGIMKSALQTKVVHLPVETADCTFLHHDQTTEKRAARCPGVKYSFLSLSLSFHHQYCKLTGNININIILPVDFCDENHKVVP